MPKRAFECPFQNLEINERTEFTTFLGRVAITLTHVEECPPEYEPLENGCGIYNAIDERLRAAYHYPEIGSRFTFNSLPCKKCDKSFGLVLELLPPKDDGSSSAEDDLLSGTTFPGEL